MTVRDALERNDILRTLDIARARALLTKMGAVNGHSSDAVITVALHKARYECGDIERDLRLASGEWLRTRGKRRANDKLLLPPGILPGDDPAGEALFYMLAKSAGDIIIKTRQVPS